MHVGNKKYIHTFLLGIPTGKVSPEDLGIYRRILLNWILE